MVLGKPNVWSAPGLGISNWGHGSPLCRSRPCLRTHTFEEILVLADKFLAKLWEIATNTTLAAHRLFLKYCVQPVFRMIRKIGGAPEIQPCRTRCWAVQQAAMAKISRPAGSDTNPTALSAFHVSIDPGTEVGIRLGTSGTGTKEKRRTVEAPIRTQRVRQRDRASAGQAAPSEARAQRVAVR
jgi:hypothetical protein